MGTVNEYASTKKIRYLVKPSAPLRLKRLGEGLQTIFSFTDLLYLIAVWWLMRGLTIQHISSQMFHEM